MAEENKKFQDDLNDLLGDAKEEAKKAASKANDMANEAREKISQFTEEAKEKASDFAEDAKQAAYEFTEDAETALNDGKNIAIIAHLAFIGWLIALVMNSNNKTEMGSFYLRQMLGFMLLSLVAVIPIVGWIFGAVVIIAWLMSLVSALSGKTKVSFLMGKQFQDWFRAL